MRFDTTFLAITFLFFCHSIFAQSDQNPPLTEEQVKTYVEGQLYETNEIFHWKNADDYTLWSALVTSDSLVSIGFQPTGMTNLKSKIHQVDLQSAAWRTAREELVNTIIERIEAKHGPRFSRDYLMPFGEAQVLPYINIRIFDMDIISEIRALPEVRYFDVMTFVLEGNTAIQRDGLGCNNYNSNPNAADYTTITPQARQSWHIPEHNIDQAWTNSNKGEGMWIAVIDSGASANQEKLNGQFAEGESTGRVVEHYGFFNNDGWQDDCGHGTAMAGLAAAPRGYDDTPAGVSYKANLITYRATDDVVINEAAEKNGVSTSLYAAGADSRVHIISMSLGDVISSGQVADGVVYATNQGKIMFAAAGTSLSFTNWYPVIFPAWMEETIAVTGVTDANNRARCDNCHDGAEVDFVVCMEKTSNGNNPITTGMPSLSQGYVGGSSAATAIMAGVAGLVWGNNPTWDKGQVINRLIQSADYFPNRNNNFGWGKVDVDLAVTPSPYTTCIESASNDVFIEITNISFPAYSEFFGSDNEWVIRFNGEQHYFRVDEDGQSGNPASFIDVSVCGAVPIIINLGQTSCGQNDLSINIKTHENDSTSDNCSFSGNGILDDDDANANQDIVIDFNQNTFVHNNVEAGNFVFTYTAYCTPLTVAAAATVNGEENLCQNEAPSEITFLGAGGTSPYEIIYSLNGGTPQALNTVGNSATIAQATDIQGTFTYEILTITDANGCSTSASSTFTTTIHPELVANTENDSPVCTGEDVVISVFPTDAAQYIFYLDTNQNGQFEVGEELQIGTSNTYTASNFVDGDIVRILITSDAGCRTIVASTISIYGDTDPNCTTCPGNYSLSGTQLATADYETNGIIVSSQTIGGTAIVDYDSGTCIELGVGFEVALGAVFTAFIDGCNGGLGGENVENEAENQEN